MKIEIKDENSPITKYYSDSYLVLTSDSVEDQKIIKDIELVIASNNTIPAPIITQYSIQIKLGSYES